MGPKFPDNLFSLTGRRQNILFFILPPVVPSSLSGSATDQSKFNKITGWMPRQGGGYTTCGSLPSYVARQFGVTNKYWGGVDGLRTTAQKEKAWVVFDGTNKPKPGDMYGLSDSPGGILTHVGVIVDPSCQNWITADAGQGDGWASDYVTRAFSGGTLTGEIIRGGGARPLAGWLDVDKYPWPK